MLEDPIKLSHTITCGYFQIYFSENLFFPDKGTIRVTNVALETLLNELFSLDRENNKCIIKEYIDQR